MDKSILTTKDGLILNVYRYEADNPIAHIIFVHGYTDHSGRYQALRNRLNENHISVTFYDQRGFGKSEGRKGYVSSFNLLVEDLALVINNNYQIGIPNILMGVSMGGAIIANYLISKGEGGVAGAILLSPMLKISDNVAPLLRKIASMLNGIVPTLKTIKLESDALSRDKSVVDDYNQDPLVYHGGAYVRTGVEFLKAVKFIQKNQDKITLPILLMHGTADRLTDPLGSRQFMLGIASHDKMFLEYPGYYHELLHDVGRQQVYEDLLAWILNEDRWLNVDRGKEIA